MNGEGSDKDAEGDAPSRGRDEAPEISDATETNEPTVSDKYNSDDSDLTIISSDNVAFKVHSYRLMTASPVFRSMLSLPSNDSSGEPIRLVDDCLEHNWVFEALLDAIYEMDVSCLQHTHRGRLLIGIAKKWDCAQVLELIRRDLAYKAATSTRSAKVDLYFEYSIQLRDPQLFVAWYRRLGKYVWGVGGSRDAIPSTFKVGNQVVRPLYDDVAPGLEGETGLLNVKAAQPGGWGYRTFLRTPPTILWALLRAMHVAAVCPPIIDEEKLATELERLLTLAYPPDAKKEF